MCIEKASRKTVTTDFKVTLSQRGELFQETIKLFRPKIGHIAKNRPKGEKNWSFLKKNFAKNRLIAKFSLLIARIRSSSPNFAHFFGLSPEIFVHSQGVQKIANSGDFGDEIAHLAALCQKSTFSINELM